MEANILGVDYYNMTVRDVPGEAYRLLSQLAAAEVNLLAFSAVPIGPEQTQLVLFPENVDALSRAAQRRGLPLTGPQRAFLIQGDDALGAFAGIHRILTDSDINVYASTGVTDGRGGFGYILYVKGADYQRAAEALGV